MLRFIESAAFLVSTSTGIAPDLLRMLSIICSDPPGMTCAYKPEPKLVNSRIGIHWGAVETIGQTSDNDADDSSGNNWWRPQVLSNNSSVTLLT